MTALPIHVPYSLTASLTCLVNPAIPRHNINMDPTISTVAQQNNWLQWPKQVHRNIVRLIEESHDEYTVYQHKETKEIIFTVRHLESGKKKITTTPPRLFHKNTRNREGRLIFFARDASGQDVPIKYKDVQFLKECYECHDENIINIFFNNNPTRVYTLYYRDDYERVVPPRH